MQDAADDASELLKALANRHRLLILCQLIDGERSVGQLAEFLGIRDSTVSQHLALLRRDRIIAGRRVFVGVGLDVALATSSPRSTAASAPSRQGRGQPPAASRLPRPDDPPQAGRIVPFSRRFTCQENASSSTCGV